MITAKFEGLDNAKAWFEPDQYKRAVRSAINKVADQAKAEASRSIREQYNLKVADVNRKITVKRSRAADLKAVIEAQGKPIPLLYFNAKQLTAQNRLITRTTGRQLKRPGKRSQGVTVQIAKGQTVVLPHAFIATMKSGHMGVFIRDSKKTMRGNSNRPAITEKAFVSVPTVFNGKQTMPRVLQMVHGKWPSVMRHELDYFMGRIR